MSNRDLDISIVTVGTNQLYLLKPCLDSLFETHWKTTFEVVVVDNMSTDGTDEWIRGNYPDVHVIRNSERYGYPRNGNIGIRALERGRYLLMLNPDIVCLPGLLDNLVAFMDTNPDVGIAGPKLLNPDMTVQPSCRRFSTPLALLARGLHLDGVFRNVKFMRQYLMADFDHESVADVDWATGALLIVRREAIARIGLMDEERYFLYSDDQDWCCRMWQAGWRVCYVPQAQAIHAHMREGMRKPWSGAARHQVWSAIRMFAKFRWKLSRTPV